MRSDHLRNIVLTNWANAKHLVSDDLAIWLAGNSCEMTSRRYPAAYQRQETAYHEPTTQENERKPKRKIFLSL
jgi:hypothetical protein